MAFLLLIMYVEVSLTKSRAGRTLGNSNLIHPHKQQLWDTQCNPIIMGPNYWASRNKNHQILGSSSIIPYIGRYGSLCQILGSSSIIPYIGRYGSLCQEETRWKAVIYQTYCLMCIHTYTLVHEWSLKIEDNI
jgi:hypothetical protein